MKFRNQIIVCLLAISVRGQSTFVYDQQSVSSDDIGSGPPFTIQSQQPIGQSFSPTLSSVGFIRLWLRDSNPGNSLGATVHVNLLANSITGAVMGASSSISMPDGFGDTDGGYINFFFSTPITVTPGVSYYFQPLVELGGDTWAISAYHFGYSGGTAFFNGTANPNIDMWFREGIIAPQISSIELTNGKPLIRFPTFSNQNYSVEYSPDLSSGSWSNLLGTNIQGNGQDIALTDTNVTMSINRFYRLKLVP